jgi:5-methylthioadenosine/S-adenosylhomocysteine deaminase
MSSDLLGSKFALEGRVVTMNDASPSLVMDRGVIYIEDGRITDVLDPSVPPPPGFADIEPLHTGGTIYPGLIELHNHLSYNVLPLWEVPQRFLNRSEWRGLSDYRQHVGQPMALLSTVNGSAAAIARYVEAKCLLSGVTTSQGIRFVSNQGIVKDYPGLVRNAESPDDPGLPKAHTHVADIRESEVQEVLKIQEECKCFLLHLCEGVDDDTHKHFDVLHLPNGSWAIADSLSGIHSICLKEEDFDLLKERDASVVWSPLSNLLLYGKTMDIEAAKRSGVTMGIGSDWSPSGSKNLLCELKVARLVNQHCNGVFTNEELVAMATRNAARILNWQDQLGSIEKGKLADLIVLNGRRGDVYSKLLTSRETSITLVVIGGVPRYGQVKLMQKFSGDSEAWKVGSSKRALHLEDSKPSPLPQKPTLTQATDLLSTNLRDLPKQAKAVEDVSSGVMNALRDNTQERWAVVLDLDDAGFPGMFSTAIGGLLGPMITATGEVISLSQLAQPIELDAITIADDPGYFTRLKNQINLPNYIKTGLPTFY